MANKRFKFEDDVATIAGSIVEINRLTMEAALAGRCSENRRARMMDHARCLVHVLETFQ